jgi:hypothetical protein
MLHLAFFLLNHLVLSTVKISGNMVTAVLYAVQHVPFKPAYLYLWACQRGPKVQCLTPAQQEEVRLSRRQRRRWTRSRTRERGRGRERGAGRLGLTVTGCTRTTVFEPPNHDNLCHEGSINWTLFLDENGGRPVGPYGQTSKPCHARTRRGTFCKKRIRLDKNHCV